MDPEVSVLLHCAHWRGLLEPQVQVELSERFNRQTDLCLEHHIKEVWAERLSKEPWLFNGAKFRLHSFCLAPLTHPHYSQSSHESATCDGRELGLTCYKDYLGTNWSCQVAELRRRGEKELSDPLALLAQPLGVGAVLCTDDGQVVLIRRSQKVAEAGGLLDIPGGHPEPKVKRTEVCEEQISVVMMQQRPDAVVSELFSSVCAEIRDEVNVPLSSLGAPVLMGVALNHTSAGRPSAEFFVRCSLSSDEVRNLYWKGGAEANESTDVVFLSRTEVLQLDGSSPLWSEMCPSAKGAVLLYQTVKPDVEPTAGKPRRSVNTKDPISTKCSN
uniref:Nudix (nucleoside diphosphate linked moiety X)-type motif 22 n=1 Tax=Kryptolebias marmoratus TaxID=37003 RepID=A0A3Q2ZM88_KRYMA